MGFLNLGGATGGGGVTRFADLEDVQVDTALDGAAPRFDQEAQIWVAGPGTDASARTFRGSWEDPSETLLWSTAFDDPADIDLFGPQEISGAATWSSVSLTRQVIADTATLNRPAVNYVARLVAASSGVGTLFFPFNGEIPGVVTKVKAWIFQNIGATSYAAQLREDAALDSGHPGTNAWREVTLQVATGGFGLALSDSAASNFSTSILNSFTAIRAYGSPSADALYNSGDVVSHAGSFWRSLYPINTDEPGASAKWEQIPAIAP